MSFDISIGDILAVSTLANNVRKRFVDAPQQFKAIGDEVKSLSNVLRDFEDMDVDLETLTESQRVGLEEHVQRCRSVLEDMDGVLEKFGGVDEGKGGRFGMGRGRRLWERLDW